MKLFVWRHNKTHHSHSMINEPCLNNNFYLDAVAVVAAESAEEAVEILCRSDQGWRREDLLNHPYREFTLDKSQVVYSSVTGDIDFL